MIISIHYHHLNIGVLNDLKSQETPYAYISRLADASRLFEIVTQVFEKKNDLQF